MARRIFTVDILSPDSINTLIKDLKYYRDNTLPNRLEKFVKLLAQSGTPTIETNMSQAEYSYDGNVRSGSNTTHKTRVEIHSKSADVKTAILVVEGEDILFIEFGAGVRYNGSVGTTLHPKGTEFGYLIGTYGKGYGSRKVWGYYDDNGELVLTSGTKATMPMYKADLEIVKNVVSCAVKAFAR